MNLSELSPDVMNANCGSRTALNHVTSRWGVLILIALQDETLRFSQLRKYVGGVSERMLSQTLKTLEQDGMIHRKSFDVVPPHVEYRLSELGMEISGHVIALARCLEENMPTIGQAREKSAASARA